MPSRVVDTNVVSYRLKKHALEAKYARRLIGHDLYISFQTLGELREWAARGKWGRKRRKELDTVLARYTVIHSNDDLCELWAYVRAVRVGHPIGVADAWIAATALAYGLELVTHNPADFAGIPRLSVISEAP